jgi:translation initiation factor 3 subunit L
MLGRTILLTYKHKTHAVDSAGKVISNADVNFYIDDVSFLLFPLV